MEESLRRQYLEAMGIQNWVGREVAPEPDVVQVPMETIEEKGTHLFFEEKTEGKINASPFPKSDIATLSWSELRSRVESCRACELHKTRTQTVFGVGKQNADLMIIGEAPGADEDRQGEPFVGKAGQLLNAMLKAIGLSREQVFIANILKCRPPGNRDPHLEEALNCEPFLLRQIDLIQPKVIMALGRIAAHNLLKTDVPVGKLRGREDAIGESKIPVVVTYHPAYLLRSPDQKAKSWQDLQRAYRLLKG
jgi:uracil-DNA glycosylase